MLPAGGAHHLVDCHLKLSAPKPNISQTALSSLLSNTPSLYCHRSCFYFVPKAPGMSRRLRFAPGSQELSWQLLCRWRERRVWAASHPARPLTHGSTGLERRTRLYYIHSSSLQTRQSRAEPSSSRGQDDPSAPRAGRGPAAGKAGRRRGAAQGEAGLSGLCMWYTSLSSSSGTCGRAP